jgi:hypothetical protein
MRLLLRRNLYTTIFNRCFFLSLSLRFQFFLISLFHELLAGPVQLLIDKDMVVVTGLEARVLVLKLGILVLQPSQLGV